MADAPRLTPRSRPRWLLLGAAVLAVHAIAIDWIAGHLQAGQLLPKMAEPMFTRLLQQQAPPPVVASAAPEPPAPARPQVRAVPAPRPKRAASTPVPAADDHAGVAASEADIGTPTDAFDVAAAAAAAAAASAASAPEAPASAPAMVASAPAAAPSAAAPPEAAASAPATVISAGPPIGPDGWPGDTRLNYRLGGVFREGALHGSAKVQWLRQDQRYETRIDIDITLLATLVMTSQGKVTPRGLQPQEYEELRRGGARRAQLRDDSILLGNGQVVPRPEGVQDTASQFVELSHRFASGQEPLEVGRSVRMWLARPGGVDEWTYDVVGLDTLRTPELGTIQAYHLVPRMIDKPRGNITAEIWFAPSLQYLPVRIRINMDEGNFLDLLVTTIQQR